MIIFSAFVNISNEDVGEGRVITATCIAIRTVAATAAIASVFFFFWCISELYTECRIQAATERLQLRHENMTKHFNLAKILCSVATEGKSMFTSRSLCNIHWIYPL